MSQPVNPDPTGVFSKTEYDLAAAKGLNAPPSDYHPETGLGLLGFGMCQVDLNAPQPEPTPNDRPAVWGLVIADMRERDAVGAEKYKTRLQPHNGRDALVDAYQEALDLCVYMRQLIFERGGQ